jgi:predicted nucleic acid-binding protein
LSREPGIGLHFRLDVIYAESKGRHRSTGPVDLMVAATAELHGLTLLHHDRDFGQIAGVTGQPLRWYGPQ